MILLFDWVLILVQEPFHDNKNLEITGKNVVNSWSIKRQC